MTLGERCEEIMRLIDEVLGTRDGGRADTAHKVVAAVRSDVKRSPARELDISGER